MKPLMVAALFAALLQGPAFRLQQKTFETPDGTTLLYGRAVPGDYDPEQARPLVLALHPGGERTSFYGAQYMRTVFLPGLRELNPIMVAPDCPTPAWSDPAAEKAAQEGPFTSWNNALENYPLTPDGQAKILRDLASWGAAHGVSGIRPWGPDTAVAGWSSFALFELDGKTAIARPGLSAISEGKIQR